MENSYVSRLIENQTICTMNGKRYIITDRMGAWNKQSVVLTWEGWQITSNSNFVSITPDEVEVLFTKGLIRNVARGENGKLYEKTTFLEKQSIPFASIINPILLAFMRSLPFAKFEERCSNEEQVISYYFDSLLSREQERQALQLSVEEQYTILKRLAKYFVEFEIVSEELYFIKDIFIEIIHD